LERIPWWEAEPSALAREREAMVDVAPELEWQEHDLERSWVGEVPIWPFDRAQPPDLEAFLKGARLRLRIVYPQAFPIVAPIFYPLEPDPDPSRWTLHDWHLNGDGSLCLLQSASAWTPHATAAELVIKAASWFLEYTLVAQGHLSAMTECGIVNDDTLDHVFTVDRPPS